MNQRIQNLKSFVTHRNYSASKAPTTPIQAIDILIHINSNRGFTGLAAIEKATELVSRSGGLIDRSKGLING